MSSNGAVSVSLLGPFGTADSIGTSLRQLYCETEALDSTCRSGPAAQGCLTSPCHVVWEVGTCRTGSCEFQYGNVGAVTATCSEVGVDTVLVTARIEGVGASMALPALCDP